VYVPEALDHPHKIMLIKHDIVIQLLGHGPAHIAAASGREAMIGVCGEEGPAAHDTQMRSRRLLLSWQEKFHSNEGILGVDEHALAELVLRAEPLVGMQGLPHERFLISQGDVGQIGRWKNLLILAAHRGCQ